MIDFDAWLARHTIHDTPHMALGLTLHFKSETMHVWTGVGPVQASDRRFEGVGNVGSISGLEIGYGRPTSTTTIELSGLDARYFALAADQAAEVRGRKAEIWLLGFGTGVMGEEWVLAAASREGTRQMDQLTRSIDHGTQKSTITLTLQPLEVMRWRSPSGLLTHDDQQRRHPGDRALERAGLVQLARSFTN